MLTSLYRKAQYLSLDIVLGAVILLRFFSSTVSVFPSWQVYVLLGSSVWLIYTIDHLRDSSRAKHSERERYKFHLHNSKPLLFAAITVILTCIYLLFQINPVIILSGGFLLILSSVYLVVQRLLARWGMKELYVAIIYTSGVLLAPFVLSEKVSFITFFLLFLLTFLNLIIFSWFEREEDRADGFTSIAITLSDSWLQRLILILISVGISFCLILDFSKVTLYFLVAFVVYAFLFLNHSKVRSNQLYRVIGDGVFLLPILFEWL